MNEDHIIAAILAAGMIVKKNDENIEPKDTISLYNTTLTKLIASTRAPRGAPG
jgi:hypothetical protein